MIRRIIIHALVVTIVVLLILAGITINMLFSENGIITNAREVSEKTRAGVIKEQIEMAVYDNQIADYTNGEKITKEQLISQLLLV